MDAYPGYLFKGYTPSKAEVAAFASGLMGYLFPVTTDVQAFLRSHSSVRASLQKQLIDLLTPLSKHQDTDVIAIAHQYFSTLQAISSKLVTDAEFILTFDPAAYSLEEVIISYPGFSAIAIYRLAHELYKLSVPVIPRMMSEYAHSQTGIDINPGATIGCPFFIDHGTGVVIGETTIIGNNVKIYQGVTLGALSVRKEDAQLKRHPTIEDNVVIYASSTILGGNTIVGHDSIIGGNTWLIESVPPLSVVYHKTQTVVSDRKDFSEPLNFVI